PTPLVLGDNRPARLIPTPALYLVHHQECYKSSCPIKTEGMSLSRPTDIPLHSSHLRPTCMRENPTQWILFPEDSFLQNVVTKDHLDVGEKKVWQYQSRFPNQLTCVMA
ncbi:hypothetical protein TNCV_4707561, partial [Trichonephila clavipes]